MLPKLSPVCRENITRQLAGYIPDKSVTEIRSKRRNRKGKKKSRMHALHEGSRMRTEFLPGDPIIHRETDKNQPKEKRGKDEPITENDRRK